MNTNTNYRHIVYERAADRVVRILMNRPEKRNAQNITLIYELDAALKRACFDDGVHAIILAGAGEHFNAGHDLGLEDFNEHTDAESTNGLWGQFAAPGAEGFYGREKEIYVDITERWRNAPKPLIAEVQGNVIAGGNMLVWACDLIVASDDAKFRDNTGAELGVPGTEFAMHPYEMGVRRAKEWAFTGGWLSAQEARACGMVNRVVPRAELSAATLELAKTIAAKPLFSLKLMKESINAAQDAQGRRQYLQHAHALHTIGHLHNLLVHGYPVDTSQLPPAVLAKVRLAQEAGSLRVQAVTSADARRPD
ncbi:enoyl-CoA hydratase [Solimonas terrae]|uniref:Enoyl-CoA hydratase n=1 Tax=Solimonas terrae TaxID=1396819 RepID=A0A6M2BU20_9GAMM|nr:enoyl-CoA hydratase [Solimonas terrae]NGY05603.1 enoyl-CoA hydratase [Solimonas terrae]